MATPIRLEHVGIPAYGELFDKTVTFYEELFGMRRIREVNGKQHVTFLSDGHGGVVEVLDVDGPSMPSPAHIALMVPLAEFEQVRDRLAGAGISFEPVYETDTGDLLVYFNDPAGNRAQLIGRRTPLE